MAKKFYYKDCYDDRMIQVIYTQKLEPLTPIEFDYVIVDEVQDLTEIYFLFITKILRDMPHQPILCLFGDVKQCIYHKLKQSDERFLIYGDKLFDMSNWVHCTLTRSFRLSSQVVQLLNKTVFHDDILKSDKSGRVFSCIDDYNLTKTKKALNYYLKRYSPKDIFILAPSVKIKHDRETPLESLIEYLDKRRHTPIYISSSDGDYTPCKKMLDGRLAILNFYQSKGLERPIVFIIGFDSSYFKYYNHDDDITTCPSSLYVALTRSTEHLILVTNESYPALSFLNPSNKKGDEVCDKKDDEVCDRKDDKVCDKKDDKVCDRKDEITCIKRGDEVCDKKGDEVDDVKDETKSDDVMDETKDDKSDIIEFNISEISKRVPPDIYTSMYEIIDIVQDREPDDDIVISQFIETPEKTYEYVANITGLAIPEYLHWKKTGMFFGVHQTGDLTIERMLKLTLMQKYRYQHLTRFDWINKSILDQFEKRLDEFNFVEKIHEKIISYNVKDQYIYIGKIDSIDTNGVPWEFKICDRLKDEHILQLVLYCFIDKHENGYLANLLSGELLSIHLTAMADKFCNSLLETSMKDTKKISDLLFLNKYGLTR
jgi:hypothetical protein